MSPSLTNNIYTMLGEHNFRCIIDTNGAVFNGVSQLRQFGTHEKKKSGRHFERVQYTFKYILIQINSHSLSQAGITLNCLNKHTFLMRCSSCQYMYQLPSIKCTLRLVSSDSHLISRSTTPIEMVDHCYCSHSIFCLQTVIFNQSITNNKQFSPHRP